MMMTIRKGYKNNETQIKVKKEDIIEGNLNVKYVLKKEQKGRKRKRRED